MGSMVDLASLAYRDAGTGAGRAAISGNDAQRMAAEAIRLAPGAALTERVRDGSDLYLYALTGAVESQAETLPQIIQEMLLTTSSERQGRVIDHDQAASMEKKKQEGYF